MGFCEKCTKYIYNEDHYCELFHCQIEEWNSDEWDEVWAFDFEHASERFGQTYNEDDCEYPLDDGDGVEIMVKNSKEEIRTFRVFAEREISYSSEEI